MPDVFRKFAVKRGITRDTRPKSTNPELKRMTGLSYRETVLLACAVMLFVCLLGAMQLLQNSGRLSVGASSLRRLYWANKRVWLLTVPLSFALISMGLWRLLLLALAAVDSKAITLLAEVLIPFTFFAGVVLQKDMRSEAERLRRAGEKLEKFVDEMRSPSDLSPEERSQKILEARLTALEVNELMGQKPSDNTWLDHRADPEKD